MNRAAVVLGVGKAGDLPALSDARGSAQRFGKWLSGEGFEVHILIDSARRKVDIRSVIDTVAKLVRRGNLDQLLIYFSGHGFLVGDAEMWMLSDAPELSSEAVNLASSVLRARQSGIPHVIFVSDACRSLPDGMFQPAQLQGSAIFPNARSASNVDTEVDRFFAAKPTQAAVELKIADTPQTYAAAYTTVLLKAFEDTPPALVRTLSIDDKAVDVVPNRLLKAHLRKAVPAFIAQSNVLARQEPDAYLECDDAEYIGRASSTTNRSRDITGSAAWIKTASDASASTAISAITAGLETVMWTGREGELLKNYTASQTLQVEANARKWKVTISKASLRAVTPPASTKRLFREVDKLVAERKGRKRDFATETEFEVVGERIAEAIAISMRAVVLPPPNPREKIGRIQLEPDQTHGATLLIRFENGLGVAVAGIKSFIGHISVEQGIVTDINYAPAEGSRCWHSHSYNDPNERTKIETLHAIATAAAARGDFRIRKRDARTFASHIRIGKGADPTLGIHAAYAYSDAGLIDGCREIWDIMRNDTGIQIFDVALMAGKLKGIGVTTFGHRDVQIYPFCPMMTRGWSMLNEMRAAIPKPALDAAEFLRPGLWSTFDEKGMDKLFDAVRTGRIK